MILKKRIPMDFYKLFRTQNMDYYMSFLVAIYEESNKEYASIGLTREECIVIIEETINKFQILWKRDELEEAEETESTENMVITGSPSSILNRLVKWGWLKSDFDERWNCYIITFPEYSQLYVELFQKLEKEDDSRERESILSIYSALFTYKSDSEKNNAILINALNTSKRLGQLLSNMQDGMRAYFDELSSKKNFIGIQEVLVEELNNNDSKKYAILTTTDSFYRYKEEVKELISLILLDNDRQKMELEKSYRESEKDSKQYLRNQKLLELCEEARTLVHQIEREFDVIERKYNHLAEQKTVFAKRALARIHYILQENSMEQENNVVVLINLLNRSDKKDEIMQALQEKVILSESFKNLSDNSIYPRRQKAVPEFAPLENQENDDLENEKITDFVPKPLYSKKQLDEFRQKNTKNGVFEATAESVENIKDLEKLLFIWQEETSVRQEGDNAKVYEEIKTENGLSFSRLVIEDALSKDFEST